MTAHFLAEREVREFLAALPRTGPLAALAAAEPPWWARPPHAEFVGPLMSNFDRSINPAAEDALKARPAYGAGSRTVYGQHSAWDFYGNVWFDARIGEFVEEVWVYNKHVDTLRAPSLRELMEGACGKYGWK